MGRNNHSQRSEDGSFSCPTVFYDRRNTANVTSKSGARDSNDPTEFRIQGATSFADDPLVDAGGLKPNTWQRFERLGAAWNQAKLGIAEEPKGAAGDEPNVVGNPRRRARTPLTESQVDAIRTARANGESVVSICRRFDVHRMTVWTHTKDLIA